MPFTKHIIEPISVSQCPLPPGEPNELECLSNLTLANLIRQLSSLGQHAGRIFEELSQDAGRLNSRAQLMHQRIENLRGKCAQLDIQSEEVTLADFQTKKQFKSSIKIDQQVVSRRTMPDAMKIMYNNADPPPALDKLNPYRTDGKDCMKFYTDPEFFFNIWCNELMRDNETRKIEKKRRKTKGGQQPMPNRSPTAHNAGISHPILNAQPQYDDIYFQQQMLLLNQNKHLTLSNNNGLANSVQTLNALKAQYYMQQQHQQQQQQLQQKAYYLSEYEDQNLPPPPPPLQSNGSNNIQISQEIYAESTQKLNPNATLHRNNIRTNPQAQASLASGKHYSLNNERPVLPPPPIPTNMHLSDLQQIQQQMIRKKISDISIGGGGGGGATQNKCPNQMGQLDQMGNADLPPPPSPPYNIEPSFSISNMNGNHNSNHNMYVGSQTNAQTLIVNKHNSNEAHLDATDFDMPLPPPPPLELPDFSNIHPLPPLSPQQHQHNAHHTNHSNGNGNGINNNMLPPPPPLPPLVESDTASSSSLISINNIQTSTNTTTKTPSKADEPKTARNCYLDDINQRRFQLKSSKKEGNGANLNSSMNLNETKENEANIQPFVNNSDVAAIIDFIRKFRPHVRDSSDEEEENSDWDE